jgi:hypothetical protein
MAIWTCFLKITKNTKMTLKKRVASEQKRLKFTHYVVGSCSRIVIWQYASEIRISKSLSIVVLFSIKQRAKNE